MNIFNEILIPQPNVIYSYLNNNKDLTEILNIICNKALEIFKDKAQLSLELYKDPEIEDEYLVLYIRQEKYTENIMEEINNIRKHYSEYLREKLGWIFITTDFLPPINEMRDFTPEEATRYEDTLKRLFKPIGKSFFD